MGDFANFVERTFGRQDLAAIRSVEALNKCILIRFAGLNKAQLQRYKVSTRIELGV